MRVGVLALQGGFAAHIEALRRLGHEAVTVREPGALTGLDGLILPGGESTAQLELLARNRLEAPLCALVATGTPVLATCAGLILAAEHVDTEQRSFGLLPVTLQRNAWGRQLDSFEATSDAGLPLVFIRAPRILATAPEVEVLDCFNGEPILVRYRHVIGATFHPELTDTLEVHALLFPRSTARVASQMRI